MSDCSSFSSVVTVDAVIRDCLGAMITRLGKYPKKPVKKIVSIISRKVKIIAGYG